MKMITQKTCRVYSLSVNDLMKGSQVGACHNDDNCEEDGEGRHQSPGRVRRVHLIAVVCCAPGEGRIVGNGKQARDVTHQDWSKRPV